MDGGFQNAELFRVPGQVVAFALGDNGELFQLDQRGMIYVLAPK